MRLDQKGLLSGVQIDATARSIVAAQAPDGSIPWWPRGPLDPWDMVEAAMGLDEAGRHGEAVGAYRWLARLQNPDGSWFAGYVDGRISDATIDLNFCSYVSTGIWHHALASGDDTFLLEAWPMLDRAIDVTIDHQRDDGAIHWARDPEGVVWPGALLTSSSCIYLSLRCAIRAAEALDQGRPDWELALVRLGEALQVPELFEDKERFAMDWYYPILAGAWDRERSAERIAQRWNRFVIAEHGVKCVSDRPWVTSGESSELVLALCALGRRDEAAVMFDRSQYLRKHDGSYWTGATYPEGTVWPREAPTWCAGAALLADAALAPDSAISKILNDSL